MDGFITAHQGEKAGVIDYDGKVIIPTEYDMIKKCINGDYFEVVLNGKYGLINTKGELVLSPSYDYLGVMENGILANKEDKYSLMNLNGEEILLIEEENLNIISKELIAIKGENDKYGIFMNDGTAISDYIYDKTSGEDSGLICVSIDGKSGYINKDTMKVVIPIIYDYVQGFIDGAAKVGLNGKMGLIDTKFIL